MKRMLITVPFVAILMSSSLAVASDAGTPEVAIDAGVVSLPADAPVADTPVPDFEANPMGALESFVTAIKAGKWRVVAAFVLAFVMFLLRKYRDKVPWFKGDRGGAILVMVLGLAGGTVTALLSEGVKLDWKLPVGIVLTVWAAVGGVQWLKRVIWPKDEG